jgi:hypothetical protein
MKLLPALSALGCIMIGCSTASMEAKEEGPIPSFSKAPYVHPLIIKDFVGWLSDKGPIIQSVDLLNAQNSNRYSGDIETMQDGETLWVSCYEDRERISYSLQADLGDGKYALNVVDDSSGTYVGKHAILVQFGKETISGEKRIVLKYLGEDRDAANAETIKSPIFEGALDERRQEFDDDSLIAAPLIPLD